MRALINNKIIILVVCFALVSLLFIMYACAHYKLLSDSIYFNLLLWVIIPSLAFIVLYHLIINYARMVSECYSRLVAFLLVNFIIFMSYIISITIALALWGS